MFYTVHEAVKILLNRQISDGPDRVRDSDTWRSLAESSWCTSVSFSSEKSSAGGRTAGGVAALEVSDEDRKEKMTYLDAGCHVSPATFIWIHKTLVNIEYIMFEVMTLEVWTWTHLMVHYILLSTICLQKHPRGEPHLITHHADRQHPVDNGDCDDRCVANQPFALPEFVPADQVALRAKQTEWHSGSNGQIKW